MQKEAGNLKSEINIRVMKSTFEELKLIFRSTKNCFSENRLRCQYFTYFFFAQSALKTQQIFFIFAEKGMTVNMKK